MDALKPGNKPENTVASVENTIGIVDHLQREGSMRVSELAAATGLSPGTVHKHLTTLVKHDYAMKVDGEYRLGLRFLDVGGAVRERIAGTDLIKEAVKDVAEQSGERTQFLVFENGRAVVLYREAGSVAVKTRARVGLRHYPNQVAAGKAMLSKLDDETVRQVIDHVGLPRVTGNTITEEVALFEEIERVRERGYALSRGESHAGLWAMSVPVQCEQPDLLGALAIAGPERRIKGERAEEELPNLLLTTVNELELNLKYDRP